LVIPERNSVRALVKYCCSSPLHVADRPFVEQRAEHGARRDRRRVGGRLEPRRQPVGEAVRADRRVIADHAEADGVGLARVLPHERLGPAARPSRAEAPHVELGPRNEVVNS